MANIPRLMLIKVAALLLLIIGILSLVGTLPTQLIPDNIFGAPLVNGLIHLTWFANGREFYHGPLFIFLLGALAVLLTGVTVKQVKGLFAGRNGPIQTDCDSSVRISFHCSVLEGEAETKVLKAVRAQRFRIDRREGDASQHSQVWHIVKNRFGIWGPLGMHVGFIIVLAGALVTFMGADIHEMEIREGEEISLKHERLSLRLDKFSILLYPGKDQVQQYISRFLIRNEKGERRHEDLGVNHPLRIGSTKIFQMRYRLEIPKIELTVFKEGSPFKNVILEKGKFTPVPFAPFSLSYDEVVPDFRVSPDGDVFSIGPTFRNPGVRLLIQDDAKEKSKRESRWVFHDVMTMHEKDNRAWDFSVGRIYKVFYSGIRVSRDPGVLWSYMGYIFLTVSSFLSSFAIPRVIRLAMQKESSGFNICLDGFSRRDPWGLEQEMNRLAESLKT